MRTRRWGRHDGPSRPLIGTAAALAFALFFALARFIAPNLFLSAVSPALTLGTRLSSAVDGLFAGFANAKALAAKNAALADENAALSLENRTLSEKAADLASLLGSPRAPSGGAGIVAGVLARPPVAAYDALIVSAGTNAGVAPGMEAFGAGGLPLGIVSAATPDFARVTLFSAPGVMTSGWIGQKRVPVTLRGAGAGAYAASAPRDAGIAQGDAVFVPGPGALPIGVVASIGGLASDPMATLFIRPAANPFSITTVVLREAGSALAGVSLATSTPLP